MGRIILAPLFITRSLKNFYINKFYDRRRKHTYIYKK
jgi:hypothetical protein